MVKKQSSKWLWGLSLAAIASVAVAGVVVWNAYHSAAPAQEAEPVMTGSDFSLSNRQLAYYFWSEYVYLSASETPPFDTERALAAQWYDEETTWQQKLTELAFDTAKQTMVLDAAARDAGFTLPESFAETLREQKQAYRKQAQDSGFDPQDAEQMQEFLISLYGPEANEADFDAYLDDTFLATAYSNALYDKAQFTDAQIQTYFDQNAENYATTLGISRNETRACTLRCIFLAGEDSKSRAEEIQAEYEKNPTEEHFADLESQYNQDEKANEQGLYLNVTPKQSEQSIRSWVFDKSRKPGDEAMVMMESGYVLIYYVSQAEQPLWYAAAESDMRYEAYRNAYETLEADAQVQTFPDRVNFPVPERMMPKEK